MSRYTLVSSLFFICVACGFDAPERQTGVRAPPTALCDAQDPLRCTLPWPSSTFLKSDPHSVTGVRVVVEERAIPIEDDPSVLSLADGFSRLTPLATGVDGLIDESTLDGAIRLFQQTKDSPIEVPLRLKQVVNAKNETLVIAYPLRPLAPNADHVAVLFDSLRLENGERQTPSQASLLALGRVEPATQKEAELAAYHAPTRTTLAAAGIKPESVIRAWDFTTRSRQDPIGRLQSMQATSAAAAASAEVAIDLVELHDETSPRAATVEGRLLAMPLFAPRDASWTLDAAGLPTQVGTADVPFRVVIPKGEGDWRVVLFGHGTSGSFRDREFDEDIAGLGLGKLGVTFLGWDNAEVLSTMSAFTRMYTGGLKSTARLTQGLADYAGVIAALEGPLGEALAAPMLGAEQNPAAGRRPNVEKPIWAGGSLGGTMGFVMSNAIGSIEAGVLNVGGAAWTHFLPGSDLFHILATLLEPEYGGPVDLHLAVLMSQGLWDDVDGGAWFDALDRTPPVLLVQQSMGDPILPNAGTEMIASALEAVQIGARLSPVTGVEPATEARGRNAYTQFRTSGSSTAVHGFGATSTPAGEAAREQIRTFIGGALEGLPVVVEPSGCVANGGTCDFTLER